MKGFLNWTSDLGGLMGIWFGASIVSFVELLLFFIDTIITWLKPHRMVEES